MLTVFNCIVFFHIVFGILWIGSAAVLEILEWEATHESRRERLATQLRRSGWFGARVFAPAAVLTILTGIIAVAVGRPAFGDAWVIVALVAVVIVSALGGGLIGKKSAGLAARLNDPNVHEDEVEQGLLNIRWAVYLDLAILFFILFDMVIRPTTLDPGFFGVSGVFFAVVLVGIFANPPRIRAQRGAAVKK